MGLGRDLQSVLVPELAPDTDPSVLIALVILVLIEKTCGRV
jgi:hypothetical protein